MEFFEPVLVLVGDLVEVGLDALLLVVLDVVGQGLFYSRFHALDNWGLIPRNQACSVFRRSVQGVGVGLELLRDSLGNVLGCEVYRFGVRQGTGGLVRALIPVIVPAVKELTEINEVSTIARSAWPARTGLSQRATLGKSMVSLRRTQPYEEGGGWFCLQTFSNPMGSASLIGHLSRKSVCLWTCVELRLPAWPHYLLPFP